MYAVFRITTFTSQVGLYRSNRVSFCKMDVPAKQFHLLVYFINSALCIISELVLSPPFAELYLLSDSVTGPPIRASD